MALKKKLLISFGVLTGAFLLFAVYVIGDATNDTYRAKTRAQFKQYTIALQQFRTEYGKFPDIFEGRESVNLAEPGMSRQFMEALSGRNLDGKQVATAGNRKAVPFLSISEYEYEVDQNGEPHLVDAYGNPNIVIVVDHDNDGVIHYTVDGQEHERNAKVFAYTLATDEYPAVNVD